MKNKILALLVLLVPLCCTAQTRWYRTQVGTGVGNCGPACVAMAVAWINQPDITVQEVRKFIGYKRKDGSTSSEELVRALDFYSIDNTLISLESLESLRDILKIRGVIVIISLTPSIVSKAIKGDNVYGRPYEYNGTHFIILEAVDSEYFVVQDPLANKDRRYLIKEVLAAMKEKRAIIIRNPDGIKDYN
jgi:ABC-type bacteriocin/lantibiotic exporter with double-glycine peptidase domain